MGSLSYLASVATLLAVKRSFQASAEADRPREPFVAAVTVSLRFVWRHQLLRALAAMGGLDLGLRTGGDSVRPSAMVDVLANPELHDFALTVEKELAAALDQAAGQPGPSGLKRT